MATLIVAAYDPSIEGKPLPHVLMTRAEIDRHYTDNNGSHLINNQAQNENAASYAIDPANAEKLWTLSENLVGQQFSY